MVRSTLFLCLYAVLQHQVGNLHQSSGGRKQTGKERILKSKDKYVGDSERKKKQGNKNGQMAGMEGEIREKAHEQGGEN